MEGEAPDSHRPTPGEQAGGVIGCIALLLAMVLLLWVTGRALWGAWPGR